jgi:hypothetical protein
MAFKHGVASRFYWHDLDMSPYLERVEPTLSRSLAECRPLAAANVVRVPGFRDFTVSLAGLYDDEDEAAEFAWARLAEDVQRPFSYLPHGDYAGGIAFCAVAGENSKAATVGDDVLKLPIAVAACKRADHCAILCPLAEKKLDGEGDSIDNGAASDNGGAGYLHCTALDLGAEALVSIEHSEDELVWETLATFDLLDATGSQCIEVAAGTTVHQYLRAVWDLTGGNATIFVAFGRR